MSDEVKALILTTGGSPEPLIISLSHFQPASAVFIVSQESVEQISAIKTALNQKGCPDFKDHKVMVDNINDATHCYQKSLEAFSYVEKAEIKMENTLADITGGTKVMSAALLLAAGARGCRISYTGGKQRNKDGIGTVITGSEELFNQMNPWQAMVLEERRKAAQMFNCFQFEASETLLQAAISKTREPRLKRYLQGLNTITQAYREWDIFRHKTAFDQLKIGNEQLSGYAELVQDADAAKLVRQVTSNLKFLESFIQSTKGFTLISGYYTCDLMANARRRASEGKFDDAIARLYRTLEMLEQVQLKTKYGWDSNKVPLADAKVIQALLSLDKDFKKRHLKSESDYLELSCEAGYVFLKGLGDELGLRYALQENEMHKLLNARNYSILAHGQNPLNKNDFEKLWKLIIDFSGIREDSLPVFPEIPVPVA
jgi:CRISPR-associated protein (TIGR02710 family)